MPCEQGCFGERDDDDNCFRHKKAPSRKEGGYEVLICVSLAMRMSALGIRVRNYVSYYCIVPQNRLLQLHHVNNRVSI